jgi:hypothetical protein
VVQGGEGEGFTPEPLAAIRVGGHLRREDLERHRARERGVLGLIDHAHVALADLPHDPVVAECLADHGGHPALPVSRLV